MKLSTAVIGYGYSASTIHVPLLLAEDEIDLVAVVTSRPEDVAKEVKGVRCYPDVKSMFDEDYVQLAVITTPNHSHFEIAKQCLERGSHVLIDKPWVISKEEGEALIEIALHHKRSISVFQNRRWDGDFLTIKNLIAENTLGKIRHFASHFDRHRPVVRTRWREQRGIGNGIWFDLGPHLVDQAVSLFGVPYSVSATCRALREGSQAVDYFHVQLHYKDFDCVLQSNPFCLGDTLRFDVQGEKGRYIKYGLDKQESALKSGLNPKSSNWDDAIESGEGLVISEQVEKLVETQQGLYSDFYALLANAISEGCAPPVTAEEALTVIDIVERVQQIVDEGVEKDEIGCGVFEL